jgi:hypothetical protein
MASPPPPKNSATPRLMGKKKALAVHLLFIHAHPPHSLSTSRHSRRQGADINNRNSKSSSYVINSKQVISGDKPATLKACQISTHIKTQSQQLPAHHRKIIPTLLHCYWVIISLLLRCLTT